MTQIFSFFNAAINFFLGFFASIFVGKDDAERISDALDIINDADGRLSYAEAELEELRAGYFDDPENGYGPYASMNSSCYWSALDAACKELDKAHVRVAQAYAVLDEYPENVVEKVESLGSTPCREFSFGQKAYFAFF